MTSFILLLSDRYSKANNKYLKSYDTKQESKHIIYLEAINLYGYTTSKFLPTDRYEWIEPKEFDLNKHTSNSSKGYGREVDLEYPKNYVNYIMIIRQPQIIQKPKKPKYQLIIADFYNIFIGNVKKLVPNIFHKKGVCFIMKLKKYTAYENSINHNG